MANLNRRGFLGGLLAAAVAPAIIRTPGLIMPIKPSLVPQVGVITFAASPTPGDTLELNGRLFVFRTRMPSSSWRKLYQGLSFPPMQTIRVRAHSFDEARLKVLAAEERTAQRAVAFAT